MNSSMEKIDPQGDHEALKKFEPGSSVFFRGKSYKVQRRTTLASGEAAVVLQNDHEQFVISAARFLADVRS